MKKFILFLIFFILMFFTMPAGADIIPLSTKSIKYYGIGVLNLPDNYIIYKNPSTDSEIIREVNYEKLRKSAIVNSMDMRKVSYITLIPSEKIALLTVEENPENNWYNVYINQQTGETGWVYTEDETAFYTYRTLFYKFGKKYGVRMFNDLSKDKKVLYSAQRTDSKKLEQLTYPKHITFTVLMGNWLLVTVNDMTKQAKVGWFNWRNDDGTLNMFPNFKEQF